MRSSQGNIGEKTVIMAANITSFRANSTKLLSMQPDMMLMQETRLSQKAQVAAGRMSGTGWTAFFGKGCPIQKRYKTKNNSRQVRISDFKCKQGGVGIAARSIWPLMAA